MKVLVLGYGSSGKAAERLAVGLGYDVEVLEDGQARKRRGQETAAPIDGEAARIVATTGAATSTPRRERGDASPLASFAIVSPGVPLSSPLVAECHARGIPLKSELQFGCEELKRLGWKLLAVTGSKGKSSVVKLVAEAINLSGVRAVPCGNYGLPVSEVAMESRRGQETAAPGDGTHAAGAPSTGAATSSSRPSWAVVEVSSFMMETTELPPDTFEAAAILNLQEDHLDRHGSIEVYHGLKRKLLGMTRHPVTATEDLSSPPSLSPLLSGSYFDNEILTGNAACAVELMRAAGLHDGTIRCAFAAFKPLPHRMNLVAELGGVRYIDDSKATSIAALVAGVRMTGRRPSVLLIAGGLPKGDDPKIALPVLTEWVRKVYLIGQSAEAFSAAWKDAVDCEICGTMDRAVECAWREAEAGETVLLSPGTASFDQFESFGERGDVFARLVKEKENEK